MLTPAQFEKVARMAAESVMLYAGDEGEAVDYAAELDLAFVTDEFEEESRELAKALDRLAADPSIRSVDHNGVFSYEDPILANAVLAAREGEAQNKAGILPLPGQQIEPGLRWALVGVRMYLQRLASDEFLGELRQAVPKETLRMGSNPLRIAVVGDAGQDGWAQKKVLKMMLERHEQRPFDFVIHLGDVYFASSMKEMMRNFLVPFSQFRNKGSRVFTLCGNHDLYYGSEAYSGALKVLGQPGRYFAIENDNWRIACLDTTFGAATIKKNDGALDEDQQRWLDDLLEKDDGKRLVFMSHHFIVSGWDAPAPSLEELLKEKVNGKLFAWYWGHEHRAAAYDRDPHGFYGASLGNGAFPDRWAAPKRELTPAWYSDSRCSCFGHSNYWPHGYGELEFQSDKLIETIHLEGGERLDSVLTDQRSVRKFVDGPESVKG